MLGGHGLATVAQLQLTMAVGIHALNVTGSGIWVSAAVSLGFAPYVLFSTYAGTVADRYSRSTVLRWSIRLRVVTSAMVAVGLVLDWPIGVLILLAALTATLATPAYPALAAATPQLVDDDDLPAANSLSAGIENAAWVGGPGLLGLLLVLGAPVAGGGLAALACFGAAAVWLGRLHLPPAEPSPDAVDDGPAVLGAFRTAARSPVVRRVLALAVVNNALYGYLIVALVLMGERALGAGQGGIGWLNAAFAVGAVASLIVAARAATGGRYRVLLMLNGLFALSGMALAMAPSLGVAAALLFLAGLFTVSAEIVAVTAIQRNTDNAVAARVFGLYDALAICAIAVCTALAGWLSDSLGTREALLAVSLLMGAATVWLGRSDPTGAADVAEVAQRRVMAATLFTQPPWHWAGPGRVGANRPAAAMFSPDLNRLSSSRRSLWTAVTGGMPHMAGARRPARVTGARVRGAP